MILVFPALAPLYDSLTLWVTVLLRVICGLALVPHGLRAFFGFFPNTGSPILSAKQLANSLKRSGFHAPIWVWSVAVVEFVAGPFLALGLFTRIDALLIFIFFLGAIYSHARFDGYFWNKLGIEYPMMWAALALYFLCAGAGPLSLDARWLGVAF